MQRAVQDGRKKTKTRSKQKNLRKDTRPDWQSVARSLHLQQTHGRLRERRYEGRLCVDSLTPSVRRHSGRSLVALAGKKINGHRPQVLRASLARLARLSELTLGLGRFLSRSSVPAPMETDCTRTRQNDSPGLLSSLATVWEDLSRLGSSLAHLRYMFILVTAVQLFEYWRPLWHCTAVCPRGRSRC